MAATTTGRRDRGLPTQGWAAAFWALSFGYCRQQDDEELRFPLQALVIDAACPADEAQSEGQAVSELTELIDRQVAAYNRRDLDGFVACYAADARVVQPDGSSLAHGHVEIRARYGELFDQSPDLHAQIRTRLEAGSFVIDEEFVTGFHLAGMPSELHAVVAYRVDDGLIQHAQLYG